MASDDRVLGAISLAEVRKVPEEERDDRTAEDVMRPRSDDMEIDPEASLAEALKKMFFLLQNDFKHGIAGSKPMKFAPKRQHCFSKLKDLSVFAETANKKRWNDGRIFSPP